jgi:hypothetical protein
MFEGSPQLKAEGPLRIHNLSLQETILQDWQSVSRDASWLTSILPYLYPFTSAKAEKGYIGNEGSPQLKAGGYRIWGI